MARSGGQDFWRKARHGCAMNLARMARKSGPDLWRKARLGCAKNLARMARSGCVKKKKSCF